jgi:hypothetical protein
MLLCHRRLQTRRLQTRRQLCGQETIRIECMPPPQRRRQWNPLFWHSVLQMSGYCPLTKRLSWAPLVCTDMTRAPCSVLTDERLLRAWTCVCLQPPTSTRCLASCGNRCCYRRKARIGAHAIARRCTSSSKGRTPLWWVSLFASTVEQALCRRTQYYSSSSLLQLRTPRLSSSSSRRLLGSRASCRLRSWTAPQRRRRSWPLQCIWSAPHVQRAVPARGDWRY